MARRRLRDLIVVLPGITGSMLSRNGTPIWAPDPRLVGRALTRPVRTVAALDLAADLDGPDVVAYGLMPDVHLVPGLVKIDGYTGLTGALRERFEIVDAGPGTPGNLIEFPYDWRLDNRISAQRLADVVEPALAAWRRYADIPDAQVIFIAHSMGGLVARYYLEVLQGWPTCRALITFGTPFRGAPQALEYLANGYKRLHLDLSAAMRSFPSVYQLLPIYPMVGIGGTFRRVADVPRLPNVDPDLAADGLRFHRELESAIAANDTVAQHRYGLLPVVGTHQPTFQSATFDGRRVTLGHVPPDGVDLYFDGGVDGDGTVPIASAAPIDLSEVYTDKYHPESHSSLQVYPHVLNDLIGKLLKMQSTGLGRLRGAEPAAATAQPAVTLIVDDAYRSGEDVVIGARWNGTDRRGVDMTAEITAVADGSPRTADRSAPPWDMKPTDEGWEMVLHDLPSGVHRVAVTATGRAGLGAPPVHDVFDVVPGTP